MKPIKTGIATSIFKTKSFDSFLTLEYAREKNLSLVQLYLNPTLENEPKTIDAIREKAIEYTIEVLCHSPFYLNSEVLGADRHLSTIINIFPEKQRKLIVLHFDERISVTESLHIIETLNKKGLTVCLENYHIEKTATALVHNLNSFNLLMDAVTRQNLDCIPVLDFPRLFLSPFTPYNPLFLSQMILDLLSRGKKELFLHMIDFTHTSQESSYWCPIGSGLMPWKELFSLIKHYELSVEGIILELEDEKLATESLEPLRHLVALL